MKTLKELLEERASFKKKQQTLVDVARTEKRQMTDEENNDFDAHQKEVVRLDAAIKRAKIIEENEKRASENGERVNGGVPAIVRSTKNEKFSLVRSLSTLAAGKQLTGIDAEVNERGVAEMREQGMEVGDGLRISLPADMGMQDRSQTVTDDDGAKGGALVASNPQFVMPLMPNVDVLKNLGVNEMGGLVGDVPLPTSGLFTFSHVGETEDVTKTDVNVNGPTLKPKRCAGVGAMSNKFLRQTSFGAENWLRTLINNAYGVAIIKDFINGAGGDAPLGLLSLITTNIETTAGAPTKSIINSLEGLIDDEHATRIARAFLSDNKLAQKMKNVLLDAGSGRFLFDGKELEGYKYERTSLMPTLDAGASHPLIFGDWKQATIGYWGNVSIMVDPYTLASASQVRLIVEGFDDVAVTNEKAFAVNKVLTV
ncbi:hypothetical protein ACIVBQ_000424 [Tenacibaculum discolor]